MLPLVNLPIQALTCLLLMALAFPVSSQISTSTFTEDERRGVTRYNRMVADYWSAVNHWLKKGRVYPLTMHAWIAELIDAHEREGDKAAKAYCARRGIRTEGSNHVIVAVEHKGWFGKRQRSELQKDAEVLPESGRLGVVVRLPFAALRGFLHKNDILFVRPLPELEEVERLTGRENAPRAERQLARGKEKLRFPDDSVHEVVSSGVILNFRPIDGQKAREILHSYGCWLAEYSVNMEYGKYSVVCPEGETVATFLDWLGHDPEVSFLAPAPLITLPIERSRAKSRIHESN